MSKFKVGDRVVITDDEVYEGEYAKVVRVEPSVAPYLVSFVDEDGEFSDPVYWFRESQLRLARDRGIELGDAHPRPGDLVRVDYGRESTADPYVVLVAEESVVSNSGYYAGSGFVRRGTATITILERAKPEPKPGDRVRVTIETTVNEQGWYHARRYVLEPLFGVQATVEILES